MTDVPSENGTADLLKGRDRKTQGMGEKRGNKDAIPPPLLFHHRGDIENSCNNVLTYLRNVKYQFLQQRRHEN